MSNRYVTDAEKAGLKRRMEAYLARLAEEGIKRRQIMLTDAETARVKEIVDCWRDESCALTDEQRTACAVLKPE